MRILIVGAGIGGMTFAALLRQRGFEPVVVERAKDFGHAGYMLSLYPLGSRILHGIGLYDAFVAASQPVDTYQVGDGHGRIIKRFDLGELVRAAGPLLQIMRGDLLALLCTAAKGVDLRMGVSAVNVTDGTTGARVRFSDSSEGEFDLVVAADGMHSVMRESFFGRAPGKETGWGVWVWLAKPDILPPTLVAEYWGAGRFVGLYPTRGALGVVAGGPEREIGPGAIDRDAAELRRRFALLDASLGPCFDALPASTGGMFFWKLHDRRAPTWRAGRVALLGDSACGFLPTAGVGASMAMESAAVLADELGRTDAAGIPRALALYEARRRKRAEAAQGDSRKLAAMMMIENPYLARLRNEALRFYSVRSLVKNIVAALDSPI